MVRTDNSSCPFCNIANREPERMLEEKENVVVFLANPRLMFGHTLVIPKRHVLKLSHLTKEETIELWEVAEEYQMKILDEIAAGCDIKQHFRPFRDESGNEVEHLHVHVQPRDGKDELYEKMLKNKSKIQKKLSDRERERAKKELAS